MLYSEFGYTCQKDVYDRLVEMSTYQVAPRQATRSGPLLGDTPEPEGEGSISSNARTLYPMSIFEELGLDEEARYFDHGMDRCQRGSLTGILSPRYVVNELLYKKTRSSSPR